MHVLHTAGSTKQRRKERTKAPTYEVTYTHLTATYSSTNAYYYGNATDSGSSYGSSYVHGEVQRWYHKSNTTVSTVVYHFVPKYRGRQGCPSSRPNALHLSDLSGIKRLVCTTTTSSSQSCGENNERPPSPCVTVL